MNAVVEKKGKSENVTIKAPDIRTAEFELVGTAPLVMHKFSTKVQEQIRATQEAGSTAKSKKNREAKDFEQKCREAAHVSVEGWYGIPASAFRAALIAACRLVGYQMTKAKMSIFVVEDGYSDDGTALVRLRAPAPEVRLEPMTHIAPCRNDNGSVDLRARPMFKQWACTLRVRYDADQFTTTDAANLLMRAGVQVGVLEGRPFSKESCGMGWGTFAIEGS